MIWNDLYTDVLKVYEEHSLFCTTVRLESNLINSNNKIDTSKHLNAVSRTFCLDKWLFFFFFKHPRTPDLFLVKFVRWFFGNQTDHINVSVASEANLLRHSDCGSLFKLVENIYQSI